jgi:hypothetical protein
MSMPEFPTYFPKEPATMFYVVATGHQPIWFEGPRALPRALKFAELARKTGLSGVKVGAGRGICNLLEPPKET